MQQEQSYAMVGPTSQEGFNIISAWYLKDWKINPDSTKKLMSELNTDGSGPLQVVMFLGDEPVATGGLYRSHSELFGLSPESRSQWYIIVYVKEENRKDSLGAIFTTILLEKAREQKDLTQKNISVFSHQDDESYKKLGWDVSPKPTGNTSIFGYQKTL